MKTSVKSLAPEIIVCDLPEGAVQYRLPVRTGTINRAGGFVSMIIGGTICVVWIAASLFVITQLPGIPLRLSGDWAFTVYFLSLTTLFFSLWLIIGTALFFLGLFLAFGHTEISIHRGQLHVTERCGSLRLTQRRPLSSIRGFGINDHDSIKDAETSPRVERCTIDVLMAELSEGRPMTVCWGYPATWLPALAEELAEACRRSGATSQSLLPTQAVIKNGPENPYCQPTTM